MWKESEGYALPVPAVMGIMAISHECSDEICHNPIKLRYGSHLEKKEI